MTSNLASLWTAIASSFGVLSLVCLSMRKGGQPVATRVEPVLPAAVHFKPPKSSDVASLPDVRKRLAPRLVVAPVKAAEILVEFMNSEGAHGYFTSKEIDEWWGFAVSARDLERMSAQAVREALESRGLKVGQSRLNSPEYATVRQRNPKAVRPVLYRIPRCRSAAGGKPDSPDSSRNQSGQSGHRPDAEPKPVHQEAA